MVVLAPVLYFVPRLGKLLVSRFISFKEDVVAPARTFIIILLSPLKARPRIYAPTLSGDHGGVASIQAEGQTIAPVESRTAAVSVVPVKPVSAPGVVPRLTTNVKAALANRSPVRLTAGTARARAGFRFQRIAEAAVLDARDPCVSRYLINGTSTRSSVSAKESTNFHSPHAAFQKGHDRFVFGRFVMVKANHIGFIRQLIYHK